MGALGELQLVGRLSARGKLWVGWNPPASENRDIRALLFPDLSTKSKIPRVAWVADGQIYGGEVTKVSFENEDEVIGKTLSAHHLQALEQNKEIGFEVPVTLDTEGLFSSVDCDERWYAVRVVGYQLHSSLVASRRVVQRLGCG